MADAGSTVIVSKFDITSGDLVHSNETSQFTVSGKIKGKTAAGSSALFVAVDQDKSGGSRVYRMDTDLLTFREAFAPGVPMQPPAFPLEISPAARWWTFNGKLFDIPLESNKGWNHSRMNSAEPVREFQTYFLTFHPKLDLVCGLNFFRTSEITLRKLSDATEVKSFHVSRNMFGYEGSQQLSNNLVYTLWNAQHQAVVAGPQTFIVMNLEQLQVPDERVMLIETPHLATTAMGQDVNLQIETFPVTSEQVVFTKTSGPAGLTISKNGRLEWTPGTSEVGKHTIKVKATAGDLTDEVEFLARVTRPEFKLDGVILSLQVNPAQTQALVACALPEKPGDDRHLSVFEEFGRKERDIISRLFLLDLETMQILVERELKEAAACICLTDEAAFVGHSNGGKLYRLKLGDLSEDERKFLGGPPSAIWRLNNNILYVATNNGGVGVKADDMSLVPMPGGKMTPEYYDPYRNAHIQSESFLQIAQDRFTIRGVVIDEQSNVQMITPFAFDNQIPYIFEARHDNDRLGEFLAAMSGGVHRDITPSPSYPQPWDRMTNYTGLFDVNGRQIANWLGASKILLSRPLAAVVQLVDKDHPDRDRFYYDDFNREGELSLELRDLVEGRTVSRFPLATVKYERASRAIGQNSMHIADIGDYMLVAYDNTMYKLEIRTKDLVDLKEPLTFIKKVHPRTVPVGEVVQIPLKARGGDGEITYRLSSNNDGLSIDAATGVLSVDTNGLWKNWLDKEEFERSYTTRFDSGDGFATAQESYEAVFGTSTGEIPFRVPFEVVASDSQGMSTKMSNQLVVLAPMADWDTLVKAREEEWERQRALAEAERARRAAERAKEKAREPGSASSAEITALAEVIDDSLTQIGVLSEQLDEMQVAVTETGESSHSNGEVSPTLKSKLDNVDQQLTELQALLAESERSASNQLIYMLVLFVVVTLIAVGTGAGIAILRRRRS
ncbi:MAG: putative Ig domain-containing protein [Pirellulales bacterium]|nr:putative Ig domain-containing protein [Pirellulales bacterium]